MNVDVRRFGGPALDAGDGDAVGLGRGPGPVEVLADRERRVVRREHEPDDAAEALRGDGVDCGFDLRFGVLQAEADDVLARRGMRRAQPATPSRCASVRAASGLVPPSAS